MDATKKRKREAEPPLITYEADNRTFDRLFKEDSLDGLKAVVRKKLNLAPSVQISLSQLRDGKSVDLEDDDDFEAFAASAHAASAVKVKVVVGRSGVPSNQDQGNVPLSSSKKKRKKKQKSSQDNSPALSRESSKEFTPPNGSVDAGHASKKRRVSFVETLPQTLLKSSDPSPKTNGVSGGAALSSEQQKNDGSVDSEQAEKKRKKKKKEKVPEKEQIGGNDSAVEGQNGATSEKEKEGPSNSVTSTAAVQETDKPEESSQPTKSKKRRRDSVTTESLPAVPASEPSKVPSNQELTEGDEVRPSKKSKDKHVVQTNLESTTAVAEVSGSSKPKSKSQPGTTKGPGSTTPAEPHKESKKRKKKDTDLLETSSQNSVPMTVESAVTQGRFDPKGSEDSTTGVEPSQKSKTSEPKDSGDSSKKSKKKKSRVQESTDHPQSTKNPQPAAAVEPKALNAKDGQDSAKLGGSVNAKTPKKTKKKDMKETAEDGSLTNNAEAPQVANKDMTEATNRAVAAIAAILRKKASQSKLTEEPEPSLVNAGPPAKAGKAAIQNPETQQVVEEDVPTTSVTISVTALEPKAPAKCPICGESPVHVRTKCPTIKSGIRSMRKRVAELQAETSEVNEEERQNLISELQTYIDKKTRKPRTSEVAKSVPPPEPANADADEENQEAPDNVLADPAATFATQLAEKINSTSVPEPPTITKPTTAPAEVQSATSDSSESESPEPKSPPAKSIAAAQSPLSRPSLQPSAASQPSTSRKSASLPRISDVFKVPEIISSGPLRPDFLGLGDVSSFTDRDLEAIIRGPRMSVKDVPESDSDTTEDESEEPENNLEEDDVSESKAQRSAGRVEYPSSSDEGDENEAASPGISASPAPGAEHALPAQERSLAPDPENLTTGEMSFQDVDANGSSPEIDGTGNMAANDAVEADLAPLRPQASPPPEVAQPSAEADADSDTAVASPVEGRHEQKAEIEERREVPRPRPAEESVPDPIEPSEPPLPASQPEPIASDDEPPMQSTPRVQMSLRARRQRGKPEPEIPSNEAESGQATSSGDKPAGSVEAPKSTRKGRGLVKLTELPVPPNPSIRIIRPAPAPKTRRQAAQDDQDESHDAEIQQEASNTRTTRSAAAKAAGKTPAKAPAKASKTPARTTTKASSQASAKPQSKAAAANGIGNTRTRSKNAVTVADPEQPSQGSNTTSTQMQETVASWAVLQENGHSQAETESPPMVDELLPSPEIDSTGRGPKGQKTVPVEEPLPEPLFVPADSQQSFPYSQYPDLLHRKEATASPNESDDEEEVAAAIQTQKPVASRRQSSMFRGLSEIASQPTLFAARLSQQFNKVVKEPVENLYGRSGQDSSESSSDSDSDAETKAATSHIPASRRAGASIAKKK